MRNGDVVVLALGPFLGKISGKISVPVADILGRIEKCIAQVPGTALFHVRIAIFKLAGLVSRGRHPGISQQLVRGVKAREIAHFSKDHGSHTEAQSGDGGNRG